MKVNLVLSGGGIRGFAHIGVLKALEDAGIQINRIACTSAGAFVAALYASCRDAKKVEKYITKLPTYKIFDLSPSRLGLMKGKNLQKIIADFIPEKNIEDLKIPIIVNATNLSNGKEVIFNSGPIYTALRASMAYPGVITPVSYNGQTLVDGGLVNPVPLTLLDKRLPVIISDVTTNLHNFDKSSPNVIDVLKQSINILQSHMIDETIAHRGYNFVHIRPNLPEYDVFELRNDPKIIERGERAARKEHHHIMAAIRKHDKKKNIGEK